MPGPLDDCWVKFNWAKRHTDELNGQFTFWRTFYANAATVNFLREFDNRLNRFTWRMQNIAPIFPEMWLTVGDIISNYRASLDYLAMILVERGRTPHLKDSRLIQFPIYSELINYNNWLNRRLPGVRRPHRTIIRRYQPYHRGKRVRHRHPLAILADLSNKDKHRELQRAFARVYHLSGQIREAINFRPTKAYWRPRLTPDVAQGQTHFLRIWGVPIGTGEPQVKMNFHTDVTITFENGLRIDGALTSISGTVNSILREFERLLGP